MAKWIKENLVLVSGILLPVLLVGGFFVLNSLPRVLLDPPQYDFVLVGYRYDYRHQNDYYLSFEVRNGKLTGRAIPRNGNGPYFNRQVAAIFRYRAATNSFEEIVFELPDELADSDDPVSLPLAETSDLTLDKRSQSPDGFTFEHRGYRGRGGLLGEIFGMRRSYDSNFVLSKDNTHLDLPQPAADPHYLNDLHFMGWIVETGNAQ